MIQSFRHRGLKALYEGRTPRRIIPAHLRKLLKNLFALDHSQRPDGMDLPGFHLHALKGPLKGVFCGLRLRKLAGDFSI